MSLTNSVISWWLRLVGTGHFPETIEYGDTSDTVAKWQAVINVQPQDGSFGPITDQMTKQWQQDHGIDPDGVVGPITWNAAFKGVGNASSPSTGGPPAGTKPMPQAVANQPAITAFAVETLNGPTPMGGTNRRSINGVDVVARIEPHTWTHRNGVLVTGLNPPIRGVTLYQVTDPDAVVAGESPAFWRVSDMGAEVHAVTKGSGDMSSVGADFGISDFRGNPSQYRIKR
jgi:hypothetical protein